MIWLLLGMVLLVAGVMGLWARLTPMETTAGRSSWNRLIEGVAGKRGFLLGTGANDWRWARRVTERSVICVSPTSAGRISVWATWPGGAVRLEEGGASGRAGELVRVFSSWRPQAGDEVLQCTWFMPLDEAELGKRLEVLVAVVDGVSPERPRPPLGSLMALNRLVRELGSAAAGDDREGLLLHIDRYLAALEPAEWPHPQDRSGTRTAVAWLDAVRARGRPLPELLLRSLSLDHVDGPRVHADLARAVVRLLRVAPVPAGEQVLISLLGEPSQVVVAEAAEALGYTASRIALAPLGELESAGGRAEQSARLAIERIRQRLDGARYTGRLAVIPDSGGGLSQVERAGGLSEVE